MTKREQSEESAEMQSGPGGDPGAGQGQRQEGAGSQGEAPARDPLLVLEGWPERRRLGALERHIFLCCDQTKPKCSNKEAGLESWELLKRRLDELGLVASGRVMRTKANCLRVCAGGPIAVVYPEGAWYRGCTPEALERVIREHLVEGRVVEELLFARKALGAGEQAAGGEKGLGRDEEPRPEGKLEEKR